MSRHILNTILFVLCLCLAGSLYAQKAEKDPSSRDSPAAVWKNERNFKQINEAFELLATEQYVDAEARFKELVERFSDAYERSEALRGLAQAYMLQDKIALALPLFEEIINSDVLPNQSHFDSMIQLASLYYSQEKYGDALRWLDRWTAESGRTDVRVFEMKASIYAQQEQHRLAIESIDQAIAISDEPKKTWYQLKLAMHYELKEFPESKTVLELLIRRWPDEKQFWTQLSAINVTLKQDKEALSILALAYRKGLLEKESEIIQLYSLYGYLDVPGKGAVVIEKGISDGIVEPTKKNWELLGNSWYAAQELDKAIVALRKAAELSLDGKLFGQISYLLVEKERWEEAQVSIATAIDKGGLSKNEIGSMYFLLGTSRANLGDEAGARKAFAEARRRASQQF